MASFIDKDGKTQQIELNVGMYREASAAGLSFAQHVNRLYPTGENQASAFTQFLASEGMFLRSDKETGLRSASLDEVLNGTGRQAAIVKEGVPASRILFPAAIMTAIEDRLSVDRTMTTDAFEGMIAVDDSINGDRYDRPVLNFSKPEAARSQAISQLALPVSMLTITASDVTRKIPTQALGLEISEQAVKATTLDIVGLALARQAAVERNERAQGYILSLLNGDVDQSISSLATLGKVAKANTFDAGIVAAGVLSQRAWIKWLAKNHTKRTIDYIVTDLDGAFAIENRTGRPVITNDNPNSPRIDTQASIVNPGWATQPKIFLTDDPNWPANTIVGFDSRYGIHRVKSLSASYEAIENLVMRRATQMRFDSGEIVYRLFDEAFEVLSLTL